MIWLLTFYYMDISAVTVRCYWLLWCMFQIEPIITH